LPDQLRKARSDTRDRLIEAAEQLFLQHGYESTTLAQIRKLAHVNGGSLHYFFPSKESLLAAVLEKQKTLLKLQIEEQEDDEEYDSIERIFAILHGYRTQLRETEFRVGCPIGAVAFDVCTNHPKIQHLIVEYFETWCTMVERLVRSASDRLPAKTRPAPLARQVLATMEGGVMLSRAYCSLEPFDQVVNQLRETFDRLLRERERSESKQRDAGGAKEHRIVKDCSDNKGGQLKSLSHVHEHVSPRTLVASFR
jgi:AcrR family transcriptional regulator